jgi:hypothetical protein
MAVKSSGTIGFVADIVAEFGGSAPYALTDYYRGGGLVPNVPVNSGVPASGTIALTDFYGAVDAVYQAIGNNVVNTDGGGGSRTIQYQLFYDSDGLVRQTREIGGSFSTNSLGDWSSLQPAETGFGWSVRVRHTAGLNDYASGSGLNVWLALTSDRSWLFSATLSEFDTNTGFFVVEISDDGGSTVFDSAAFAITLTNEGP